MQDQSPLQSPSKSAPWGNYLKEFLMLFLAISLGFWIENLRQDGEERRIEKEFTVSLLEDLVEDSSKVVVSILANQMKMNGFDSLLTALYSPTPYRDSTLHLIYYLQRKYTGSNQSVTLSERTLKQLSSIGGYRLIENRQIASEIAHYQEAIDAIKLQGHAMIFEYQIKSKEMASRLFEARASFGLTRETAHLLLNPKLKLKPLDGSARDINEYASWLTSTNGTFFTTIGC